ncbi:unnamed protein product [Prorocentrum cordatum]|uniref:Uncharacterized protein n=1 Tax=Prorocentrum cordatum TaxID=2364126 RepID=A0ABN9RQC8_9DINO|nr:unnamed protein product [Polarella glacialis]
MPRAAAPRFSGLTARAAEVGDVFGARESDDAARLDFPQLRRLAASLDWMLARRRGAGWRAAAVAREGGRGRGLARLSFLPTSPRNSRGRSLPPASVASGLRASTSFGVPDRLTTSRHPARHGQKFAAVADGGLGSSVCLREKGSRLTDAVYRLPFSASAARGQPAFAAPSALPRPARVLLGAEGVPVLLAPQGSWPSRGTCCLVRSVVYSIVWAI